MTFKRSGKLSWPKDLLIKLLSLVFAVFLWYFVAGEDRVDMNVQVPVEIVNLPRDLIISNQFKTQLEVTVSGPRGMIRKLAQQSVSRSIDLSNAKPGNVVIRNDPDSIQFPHGIRVLRIQPSHIILLLDRLVQKTLPIEAVTRGKPPAVFELAAISLAPDKLTLSGPKAILSTVDIIKTVPIDLSTLTGPVTRQVSLDLRKEVADLIGDPIVTATISLRKKIVKRTIKKLPLQVTGLAEGVSATVKPRFVKAAVHLPLMIVNSGNDLKGLLTATVNAEGLPPGRHEVAVTMKAGPEIMVETISPEHVNVNITAPKKKAPAQKTPKK